MHGVSPCLHECQHICEAAGHFLLLFLLFMQVDALKMEALVDSFVGALGLEKSYTLVVINPKWSPSLPSYNYRIGFSEAEIRLLNEQVSISRVNY